MFNWIRSLFDRTPTSSFIAENKQNLLRLCAKLDAAHEEAKFAARAEEQGIDREGMIRLANALKEEELKPPRDYPDYRVDQMDELNDHIYS